METGNNTHLLRSLFERLELAGITVSPADYVRIASILEARLQAMAAGENNLEDLSQARYLIAPIIARSETDQKIVYNVFDDYLADIDRFTRKITSEDTNRLTNILTTGSDVTKPLSQKRFLLALLLLLVSLCGIIAVNIFDTEVYNWEVEAYDSEWVVGDSVQVNYKLLNQDVDLDCQYQWQLLGPADSIYKQEVTTHPNWSFLLDSLISTDYVYLVFSVLTENQELIFADTTVEASILCANRPVISGIDVQGELGRGKDLILSPVMEAGSTADTYHWIISNGKESISLFEEICTYNTGNSGVVDIELRAYGPSTGLSCESSIFKALELEQRTEPPFAEMALRPLSRLNGVWTASFKWFVWGFWLVLFFVSCYFLWIFRKRIKYSKQAKKSNSQSLKPALQKVDRPPYSIEFKNENKAIHSFEERSMLAKAMHERRSRPSSLVDVNETITSTIAHSGYPSLVYRKDRVPSQYLFLIHQSHRHSHDARLFDHLADLMKEDDVLMLTMHYKDNPALPYSDEYPEGISIHQLKSKYGAFRVLLFTDGTELVNSYAGNKYGLDAEALELVSVFEDLFLVTPTSAHNWSFGEAQLYQIALLFPADVHGLFHLSQCLESYDAEADRKRYKDWRSEFLSENRKEIDSFEDLRKPEPYREMLGSTLLYEWFLALSVFPSPNWDFTISVGKAMEERGLYLSFDNLLKLSRIPALHKASYHPALLDKMHKALQEFPDVELIARKVLQEKLQEVDYQNMDCFVSGTHEILTVKNEFLLDSEDESNVRNVLRLVEEKRFSKLDIGDLVRHSIDPSLTKSAGKQYKKGLKSLNEKLKGTLSGIDSGRAKRRMLVGFSLNAWTLFLIYCLYLLISNDHSTKLEVLSKESQFLSPMVQVSEALSEGMRFNNEAVLLFDSKRDYLAQINTDSNLIIWNQLSTLLDSANVKMPGDQLVQRNQMHNILNASLSELRYIESGISKASEASDVPALMGMTQTAEGVPTAYPSLIKKLENLLVLENDPPYLEYSDSLSKHMFFQDLMNLTGLAHYYNGSYIEAVYKRDSIIARDETYFSALTYSPTLLELLPKTALAKQFTLEGYIYDSKGAPYENTKVIIGNHSTETDASGYYLIRVDNPLGKNQMEVVLENGGVFEKAVNSEFITIGTALHYNKDFKITSSSLVYPKEPKDKSYRLLIEILDDRGTLLEGVEFQLGDQAFTVDGRKYIEVPANKGYTVQVTASKKGYKPYGNLVNTTNFKRRKIQRIVLEKEPKIITVNGNVNDELGQGLSNYSIHLGDGCSTLSSGKGGRFLLSCEIPPYDRVPRFLILKDRSGVEVDRQRLGQNRTVLFLVSQRMN